MRSEDQPCAYKGCKIPTTEKDDEFCQFHRVESQLDADAYLFAFTELVKTGTNDFRGFVFPPDIKIKNLAFPNGGYFHEATFQGNVTIHDCSITEHFDFQGAKFEGITKLARLNLKDKSYQDRSTNNLKIHLEFIGATFKKSLMVTGMRQVHSVQLDSAILHGNSSFSDLEILGGVFLNNLQTTAKLSFGNCEISEAFYIHEATLGGDLIIAGTINAPFMFWNCTCDGTVNLSKVKIPKNGAFEFRNTRIGRGLIIEECATARRLLFENLTFGEHASVRIINPNFDANGCMSFSGTSFPEYRTTFKGIFTPAKLTLPLLRINHCNLSRSYFEQCDFSGISLYTSDYDNAVFLDCDWPHINSPKRDNAIYEDYYIHSVETQKTLAHHLRNDSLKDITLMEVSSLYNQFKNSFDRSKRYEISGEFFYNELELKREYYRCHKKGTFLLYSLFKGLSMYGQRPRFCALMLIVVVLCFTAFSLHWGLEIHADKSISQIQHDFARLSETQELQSSYISNLGTAVRYAVERIVPFRFVEFSPQKIYSSRQGAGMFFISLAYSAISLSYIYFTLIGLRRHFKRF